MQDFTIERVGQSDLVFNGDMIGQSGGPRPMLKIYRTKGGKFIAQVSRDAERSVAEPFDQPSLLVSWLRSLLCGISEEAQVAIEGAAKNDDAFRKFWTDRVE
jgi:hypothetical protein